MAKRATKAKKTKEPVRPWRLMLRAVFRGALGAVVAILAIVALYAVINPPTTPYMIAEGRRIGAPVTREWRDLDQIAPVMARAAVAAEDANFCLHWGFDMAAIRAALEEGGRRGASTISQQVVKNAYLWQGRSWLRKALEALMTPAVEAIWSKRRILEIYLNVAEFGEGIFGVEAAARHYFGVSAEGLSATQAALLASALPNPKDRNPAAPSRTMRNRTASIRSGAETIRADGRASCFED